MGFSVTGTHAIIFIASIMIATTVVAVVSTTTDVLESGIKEKSKQALEKMRTEIKVLHVNPTTSNTTIYVLNSGSEVLNPNATGLFIDGDWQSNINITMVNRSTNIQNDFWDPNEIIEINASDVSPGKHMAKVVVGSAKDEYPFDRV
jgi:flagellar protein FlaG